MKNVIVATFHYSNIEFQKENFTNIFIFFKNEIFRGFPIKCEQFQP